MAGPIRISVLADVGKAVKEVTRFSDVVDSETKRVVTTLGDSKLTGGFGKIQEGFDVLDTRAMGFRDTVTGVQDSLRAYSAFTLSTAEAQQQYNDAVKQYGPASTEAKRAQEALADTQLSTYDKLLLVGTGVGDLASGFANFIVPMAAVATSMNALSLASIRAGVAMAAQKVSMVAGAVATGVMTAAQWALNVAMSANPIGLIILAIVALVAAIVIAYKKSETFRAIVQAVWVAIKAAVLAVVEWFKGAMTTLWAKAQAAWEAIKIAVRLVMFAITTYINAYKAVVVGVWNAVRNAAVTAWNAIKNAVSNVINTTRSIVSGGIDKIKALFSPSTLYNAGRQLITGLVNGIGERIGAAIEKVRAGVAKIKGLLPGSPIKWGPLTSWNNGGAGKRLMGTLADGIRAGAPGVAAALSDGISADARINVGAGGGAAGTPVQIVFEATGDPLMDAIMSHLRQRIRVGGGNVQAVLGR